MREKYILKWLAIIFVISVLGILIGYIINFGGAGISKDLADWGVLGDYFGGLLNPLISALTLFFVARTYLNQKEEMKRVQESADKADCLRKQATDAQISLAESYLKQ